MAEFMFPNVAYRATVYRTGVDANRRKVLESPKTLLFYTKDLSFIVLKVSSTKMRLFIWILKKPLVLFHDIHSTDFF